MAKSKISDRATASGVSLSFGLVNFVGSLHTTTTKDKTEELKMVCPTHVTPVTQAWHCADCKDVMLQSATGRAKELDDGKLVLLTQEQVDEAKKSKAAKNQLEIKVHPTDEIKDFLVPGQTYIFMPGDMSVKSTSLLLKFIKEHPELTCVGMINMRDNDKMVRLVAGLNDQLLVQEVSWPADVKSLPSPQYDDVDAKMYAMAEELLTSLAEPFDMNDYTKAARDRMAQTVVAASGGAVAAPAAKAAKPSVDDLTAALEASLAGAAAKPKKAPAKRTRKAS